MSPSQKPLPPGPLIGPREEGAGLVPHSMLEAREQHPVSDGPSPT